MLFLQTLQLISTQYDCFNQDVYLNGVVSELRFYLHFSADMEAPQCKIYLNEDAQVVLLFEGEATNYTTTTKFSKADNLLSFSITDSNTFGRLIQIAAANFVVSFRGGNTKFQMAIQNISHTQFDARNCWSDVEFAVLNMGTAQLSVTPLSCSIAATVDVFFQYFDKATNAYISVHVEPEAAQAGNTSYKGYTSNTAFDMSKVLFFKVTAIGNTNATNVQEIAGLIKALSSDLDLEVRLYIVENTTSAIKKEFYAAVKVFNSDFSRACYKSSFSSTLYDWYAYTIINATEIYMCFKQVLGATHLYAAQKIWADDGSWHE